MAIDQAGPESLQGTGVKMGRMPEISKLTREELQQLLPKLSLDEQRSIT
jgi:hypothetical protein